MWLNASKDSISAKLSSAADFQMEARRDNVVSIAPRRVYYSRLAYSGPLLFNHPANQLFWLGWSEPVPNLSA